MTRRIIYSFLLYAIAIAAVFLATFVHPEAESASKASFRPNRAYLIDIPTPIIPSKLTVKLWIVEMIREEAPKYGIEPQLALDLAGWESQFNHKACNRNSTACGLFQFIDSTWEARCRGIREDPNANTRCFLELWENGEYSHWTADPKISTRLYNAGYVKENEL